MSPVRLLAVLAMTAALGPGHVSGLGIQTGGGAPWTGAAADASAGGG